jgi:uncharacterized protein YegP (UPF0339 family)
MKPKKLTIELYKSQTDGQYRFRIKSRNGQIVAQSEGYVQRKSALKTAQTLAAAVYTIKEEQ